MSLQAGSRLGPYELAAPIGAGGMGEVWRGTVSERSGSLAFGALDRLPFSRASVQFFGGVRSPDGKRFIVERWDSEAFTEPIRLIRSWPQLFEK